MAQETESGQPSTERYEISTMPCPQKHGRQWMHQRHAAAAASAAAAAANLAGQDGRSGRRPELVEYDLPGGEGGGYPTLRPEDPDIWHTVTGGHVSTWVRGATNGATSDGGGGGRT